MCTGFNAQLFKWIWWISNKFALKCAVDAISTSGRLFGVERHVCHLHKLGTDMFAIFSALRCCDVWKSFTHFIWISFLSGGEALTCRSDFSISQIYITSMFAMCENTPNRADVITKIEIFVWRQLNLLTEFASCSSDGGNLHRYDFIKCLFLAYHSFI